MISNSSSIPVSSRIVLTIGVGLILFSLLNGAGFFLKRIGVWEAEQYAQWYPLRTLWTWNKCIPGSLPVMAKPDFAYLYENPGWQLLLKLGKDGFLLLLCAGLLVTVLRRPSCLPRSPPAWLGYGLAGAAALAALLSYLNFQQLGLLLAGARGFTFVVIALGACCLAAPGAMAFWARCAGVLLALQLLLLPLELTWGLPKDHFLCTYGGPELYLPSRLSGSFNLPNSLGVFLVVAAAFYASFNRLSAGALVGLLLGLTLALFLCASATGLITLWLCALAWGLERASAAWRALLLALLAAAAAGVLYLPELLGRLDLFQSLWGRVETLLPLFSADAVTLIFGQGLGAGSNAAINLLAGGVEPSDSAHLFISDSTLTLLLAQTGLLGAGLFYLLLLWLWWRQPQARLFYLSILLTSLTLNLNELFPVNLMLGLAIAAGLRAEVAAGFPATHADSRSADERLRS